MWCSRQVNGPGLLRKFTRTSTDSRTERISITQPTPHATPALEDITTGNILVPQPRPWKI